MYDIPSYARGLLMVAPVFADANPAARSRLCDGLAEHARAGQRRSPVAADDNLVVRIVDPSGLQGLK
jgi:hypothetical protein